MRKKTKKTYTKDVPMTFLLGPFERVHGAFEHEILACS
jgi:hypothetical protein